LNVTWWMAISFLSATQRSSWLVLKSQFSCGPYLQIHTPLIYEKSGFSFFCLWIKIWKNKYMMSLIFVFVFFFSSIAEMKPCGSFVDLETISHAFYDSMSWLLWLTHVIYVSRLQRGSSLVPRREQISFVLANTDILWIFSDRFSIHFFGWKHDSLAPSSTLGPIWSSDPCYFKVQLRNFVEGFFLQNPFD